MENSATDPSISAPEAGRTYAPSPGPGYWMAADGSWHPPQAQRVGASNGMATTGLVLGIIGCVTFWVPGLGALLGVLAIIFGGVGLSIARQSPEQPRKGHAVGGISTGVVAIVLSVGAILAFMAASNGARDAFDDVSTELGGGVGTNTHADGWCNETADNDPDC